MSQLSKKAHAPPATVSLTSYVDYLLKAGRPKVNAVRRLRAQYERGYNPALDYYREFRSGVAGVHQNRLPVSELLTMVEGIDVASKRRNYELLVRGYQRFWARNFQEHEYLWVEPPKVDWSYSRVTVRINPEVALLVDRQHYYVKLYNKKDPLKKGQLDLLLHMLQTTLALGQDGIVVGILDVRRGRLFEATAFDSALTPLLEGEALAFQRMWSDDSDHDEDNFGD